MAETPRQHRSRWRPDPDGLPGLQLSDRDVAIAELTFQFRHITSDDLVLAYKTAFPAEADHIGKGTGLKQRLMRLFHAEVLNRAPATKVLSARQERNLPFIYHLGRRAVPLLVQRGYERRHLEPATKSPSALYLEHHLGVTELHLALRIALAERSEASLAYWINENTDTRVRWSERESGRLRKYSVNPDAVFAIDDGRGQMPIFYDFDNGTMSSRRFRWKIDSYTRLWRQGRHKAAPYHLSAPFRVLFSTVSAQRLERLRTIARDADPHDRGGLNLFWFGLAEHYEDNPHAALDRIWYLPSGEKRFSILERDVKRRS